LRISFRTIYKKFTNKSFFDHPIGNTSYVLRIWL